MRKVQSVATIVWLTAPVPVLWQRINGDPATGTTRPALTKRKGHDEVEQLLGERSERYERAAEVTIDTFPKTPIDIAREVAIALDRLPAGSA